jgi:hypothetical protein
MRWDDEDAITHDPLSMRNDASVLDAVIGLNESHLPLYSSVRMLLLENIGTNFHEIWYRGYTIGGKSKLVLCNCSCCHLSVALWTIDVAS